MGYSGLLHRKEVRGVLLVCLSMVIIPIKSIGTMADDGATGAIGAAQIPAIGGTPKSDRLDQGSCWYAIFFLPQAQAQRDPLPHPLHPSYITPSFAQSYSPTPPPRKRDLNRPSEPMGRSVRGSTEPSAEWHATSQDRRRKEESPTKKRKSAEKRQKTKEAAATRSVISPASAATEMSKKPTSPRSAGTKAPDKLTSYNSAITKSSSKPISRRRDVKKIAQRASYSAFIDTKAAYENDLFRISKEAANGPEVFAFRNCIASYAGQVGKEVDRTWAADLVIRATEGECRAQFDEMARQLSTQFDEARVELVMQQLIETTLLPAAKAALSNRLDARALSIPSH
jgi:hypothetical protein